MKKLQSLKKVYENVLKRNIGNAERVEIDIERIERGFLSKIRVTSKGHIFWASKSGNTLNKSLKKTTQALIRQTQKSYGRYVNPHHFDKSLLYQDAA